MEHSLYEITDIQEFPIAVCGSCPFIGPLRPGQDYFFMHPLPLT